MGQVTISLDQETETKMKTRMNKKKCSKSKWIADLIRGKNRERLAIPYTKLWGLERSA